MKKFQQLTALITMSALIGVLTACGGDNAQSVNSNSSLSNSNSSLSSSSISSSISLSSSSEKSLSSSSSSSSTSSSVDAGASIQVGTLAQKAAFNGDGLTLDKNGNIFVGTSKGHSIYRVTTTGEITLFATLANGSANGSDFDSKGNLFVANETSGIIHKISPDGVVSDFLTGLDGPAGIYIDEQDNLIVGMFGYTNPAAKVLKITPDGIINTLASDGGLANVVGVAGDGKGRYFASNFYTGEIFEVTGGKVQQIGASGTRVNHIKYFKGYIYTPNPFNQEIRRMDLFGNFNLIAGIKSVLGSQDGAALQATFSRPNSIDISADGKTIYILDFNTGDVRTVTLPL